MHRTTRHRPPRRVGRRYGRAAGSAGQAANHQTPAPGQGSGRPGALLPRAPHRSGRARQRIRLFELHIRKAVAIGLVTLRWEPGSMDRPSFPPPKCSPVHPFPPPSPSGLVPRLRRYYGALRLLPPIPAVSFPRRPVPLRPENQVRSKRGGPQGDAPSAWSVLSAGPARSLEYDRGGKETSQVPGCPMCACHAPATPVRPSSQTNTALGCRLPLPQQRQPSQHSNEAQ